MHIDARCGYMIIEAALIADLSKRSSTLAECGRFTQGMKLVQWICAVSAGTDLCSKAGWSSFWRSRNAKSAFFMVVYGLYMG